MVRLTHIVAGIARKSGGVGPAVLALAKAQQEMRAAIRVVCLGRHSEESAAAGGRIEIVRVQPRRPAAFGFSLGFGRALLPWRPTIVHAHGLWMYSGIAASKAAARASVPLIVSPHGMLDPWALRNSAWKKKIAGWLYENRNLRAAACIHALCESEYRSIRAYGLANPVCIIPNGIDLPEESAGPQAPPWTPQVSADKKVMLFLGRIHPKKGLANLIRAWAIIKSDELAALDDWHLVIAGWSQKGHEGELKRLVQELNLGASVSFTGPLYDTAKDAALRAADAFILPSLSEGLPMAVLEAWAYGLPVIMTRECNLPEGFDAGAALEIRPEVDSVAEGLRSFFGLSQSARMQIGRNGLGLVRSKFAWPSIAAGMLNVYKWVLGERPRPACVRLN